MTRRKEFTPKTKRQALARSGGRCEAEGPRYGFPEGVRCNADLAYGVEFHHKKKATYGGDNSLANCEADCPKCHRYIEAQEMPEVHKSNRVRDKHQGVKRPKGKIQSRGFSPPSEIKKLEPTWAQFCSAVTARKV